MRTHSDIPVPSLCALVRRLRCPRARSRLDRRGGAGRLPAGIPAGAVAGSTPCSTSTSRLYWASRLNTITVRIPSLMASGIWVTAKMEVNLTKDSTTPPSGAGEGQGQLRRRGEVGDQVGDGRRR